jgi:quercetin dioxygenase-like cupin family protein
VKHFRLHRKKVDVQPVLSEILAHSSAWAEQTGRQSRIRVQAETNGIPLRGLRRSKIMGRRRRDVHETRYTSMAMLFPRTVALLEGLADELDGDLGRAKLARLPPGARVLPHVDRGEYYEFHDRYHLVVDSRGASLLQAGGEEIRMRTGELWWFDNKAVHSARNESQHHRTHLVFDLQPRAAGDKERTSGVAVPDPRGMLEVARFPSSNGANEEVAAAIGLYLAVRRNPERWEEVLNEHGCVERAQRRPIGVLAELLWPELEAKRRRCRESAIGWALALLDLGRLEVHQIPGALRDAGGIRAVHRIWRSSKDQYLYGSD